MSMDLPRRRRGRLASIDGESEKCRRNMKGKGRANLGRLVTHD